MYIRNSRLQEDEQEEKLRSHCKLSENSTFWIVLPATDGLQRAY